MNTRKYSIIGWILIFAITIGFFLLNKPSAEKLAAQKAAIAAQDSIRRAETEKAAAEAMKAQERYMQELNDTTSALYGTATGSETIYTLRNNLLSVDISSKGAAIVSATLFKYKDRDGNPMLLFDEDDRNFAFLIDGKNENIVTSDRYFSVVGQNDSTLTLRLNTNGAGYLDFTYTLPSESYIVSLDVKAVGMQNFFPSQMSTMGVRWNQRMRHQEKGYMFEQRFTYLSYRESGKDPNHINENKSRAADFESVDWLAYKNQFFSTVLIGATPFTTAHLTSSVLMENNNSSAKFTETDTIPAFYMKNLGATMNTSFDPSGTNPSKFQFYIGPNHFRTLKACSKQSLDGSNLQLDKLVYMGLPIVRLINRYVIVYLFDFLASFGWNMGIVLLVLTLIVKLLVLPFTRKQYMSSAKMRALKPHIDEISAKYPNPEDAMQKQQETMQMYSKYGVSPMGGCLPALIQMPIWMALFFFVPNAIELRQQHFLWASDLSAYDDVISWSGNIPLLGNHLSLFCLLFCVMNILNTVYSMKMQPAAGQDQSQQNMMKWMMYLMPVIFLFTLNGYSSGLNYYYCISTVMSILIMIIMKRPTNEKKLLDELETNYKKNQANPPKKTSGMMARLEAMQKEQERIQREQQERAQRGKR